MNEETPSSFINEQARVEARKEVLREKPGIEQDPNAMIRAIGKKFIEKQIDRFPEICEIARVQNILEWKNQEKYGKKGKFTDSYGWSEDGTFKFDYKIPQELYLFMQNLVYYDFWSEENERIWRKFMKRICDGDDPLDCLMQVKKIYGSEFRKTEKVILGPDNQPII